MYMYMYMCAALSRLTRVDFHVPAVCRIGCYLDRMSTVDAEKIKGLPPQLIN